MFADPGYQHGSFLNLQEGVLTPWFPSNDGCYKKRKRVCYVCFFFLCSRVSNAVASNAVMRSGVWNPGVSFFSWTRVMVIAVVCVLLATS